MLNGSANMDGALLLNVANESCPQPQTSEHLAAVEIMHLQHIIILQNKVALIQENVAINQHEAIRKFIQVRTIADNAPVVPISAQLKYNIDVVCEYIVKKIPIPERSFISPPNMIVIRSFDVNKPGFEIDELSGWRKHPQGGLIGVGTTMDPTLTCADRLVGQVLGEVGSLPEVFLAKGGILMLNIGSMSTGAKFIAVRNDLAKLQLTSPVCTSRGEKIVLSRRVEKHWCLIGPHAWSKAIGTVVVGGDLVASVGGPSHPEQTKKTYLRKKFHRHRSMPANICQTSLDERCLCRRMF
ncbi:unnamed protein product, partial [Prunus brigantina]